MFSCSSKSCSYQCDDRSGIEGHMVSEHGIHCRKKYLTNIDVTSVSGSLVKKRGQTVCNHCGVSYNNRIKPDFCVCGRSLDLSRTASSSLNVFQLTDQTFSVRKFKRGINKRVIVNVFENICYSEDCMITRAHYSDISKFMCMHLEACADQSRRVQATKAKISLEQVSRYVKCERTLSVLKRESVGTQEITVFKLPDRLVVLPYLSPISHACQSGYVHIDTATMKCPISKCSLKPRLHYLVKTKLMCIHVLLCKIVNNEQTEGNCEKLRSCSKQFSKMKTVEFIIESIMTCIPSVLHENEEKLFLQRSFVVQQNLLQSMDISRYEVVICSKCTSHNCLRKKKVPGGGFIVTPDYMIEVSINTYLCKTCDTIFYPNMFKDGFVPVCENLMVSWSYMVEARNHVKNGSKMYNFFSSSLRRLCLQNANLASNVCKIDFHNMSARLSKVAIAYNSITLLNPVNDLDALSAVLCLHCGLAPITLLSDGNVKNSILLRSGSDNLVFDREDSSEIPSLTNFVKSCAITVAGSGLFQHFPKAKINVFKIPPIIGQKLSGQLINREYLKKSIFQDEIDLSAVNFVKLEQLITSGEFNLLKARSLSLNTLRKMACDLHIPKYSKQSKVMLENVILKLVDWLMGGNSTCHKYMHSVGETGGWTDQWCPHNIKYGSKIMVLQESVVDPADIYLSLLWPPLLQILDDPCTFISHMFCSERDLAGKIFGVNKGCFEPPHPSNPPRTDHSCPDILPLAIYPRTPCLHALDNPSLKIHPMSQTVERKVLGTRLSESHKSRNECLYHNIGNCIQASHLKTMSQEGLQQRRKCKRVAVGKRQTLESHFIFNFLLDVLENLEVRRKQEHKMSPRKFDIDSKSLLAVIQSTL